MRIRADHRTDIGDRENNEDFAGVFACGHGFLVADGMGGQAGGEIASELAARTVTAGIEEALQAQPRDEAALLRGVEGQFRDANQRLLTAVRQDPGLWGLGTTLTVGVVHASRLLFGHIGDSRLYRWRAGACEQLTVDHTRAEELARYGVLTPEQARNSPHRHVLTRHLGAPREVRPQVEACDLHAGDRLLLCSDGLNAGVDADGLSYLLGGAGDPGTVAERLVSSAREGGVSPRDNITALVVLIEA